MGGIYGTDGWLRVFMYVCMGNWRESGDMSCREFSSVLHYVDCSARPILDHEPPVTWFYRWQTPNFQRASLFATSYQHLYNITKQLPIKSLPPHHRHGRKRICPQVCALLQHGTSIQSSIWALQIANNNQAGISAAVSLRRTRFAFRIKR